MGDAFVSVRLSDEQLARLQRARILEALCEALTDGGYARLRVADIAERGGFSRKTFYDHFANKAEAFFAAHDELVDRAQRVAAVASEGYGTPPVRVATGMRAV